MISAATGEPIEKSMIDTPSRSRVRGRQQEADQRRVEGLAALLVGEQGGVAQQHQPGVGPGEDEVLGVLVRAEAARGAPHEQRRLGGGRPQLGDVLVEAAADEREHDPARALGPEVAVVDREHLVGEAVARGVGVEEEEALRALVDQEARGELAHDGVREDAEEALARASWGRLRLR
jgi:hypothetical protein